MMTLKPETILQRRPSLEIILDSAYEIRVTTCGHTDSYPEYGLVILAVFARPTSLRAALGELNARGLQEWVDLTGTINKLYRAGALTELAKEFTPDAKPHSFGAPPVHISMLNDRGRTDGFLQAISEVVKPGDVVVDIGTGTGILAVAAARAGASRVYAIEAGAMADAARAVFEASEYADKLTLIRGWSTQVTLPEPADVLVSEIIGRDPFEERVLQTTLDARRRLLRPGARLVPNTIRAYVLALTAPTNKIAGAYFTGETVKKWRDWYDVDFTPLVSLAHDSSAPTLHVASHQAANWTFVADSVLLAEVDMTNFQELVIESVAYIEISRSGLLNGLLMYFEAGLGPTTVTTHPLRAARDSSWFNPVWLFRDGRAVNSGDRVGIHYSYNVSGQNSEMRLVK